MRYQRICRHHWIKSQSRVSHYLDKEINGDYEKRNKNPDAQNLDPIQIQWLYMRSFFPEIPLTGNIVNVLKYYRNLSVEYWTKQSVYMQGMIALFLNRGGRYQDSEWISWLP